LKPTQRVAIAKFFAVMVLLGGPILFLRLVLPPLAHSRRLFDLGGGYSTVDRGFLRFYHDPKIVGKAKVEGLAKELSEFAEELVKRWGSGLGLKLPEQRVDVLLHSDEADFKRYWMRNRKSMPVTEALGLYHSQDSTIGVRDVGGLAPLRTLRHEMVHLLIDRSGLRGGRGSEMPRWLNEGLAMYFEGGAAGGTLFFYGEKPPVSLYDLVALSPKKFYAKDTAVNNYREAVLLVAFFIEAEGGQMQRTFFKFIRNSSQRRGRLGELAGPFGLDEVELERRWLAFIAKRQRAALKLVPEGSGG